MSRAQSARIVAGGGALFAAYVLSHPRGAVREATNLEEAIHSMAVEPAWVLSHVVGLVAVAAIAFGIGMLLRDGWLADDRRARAAGWLLFAGSIAATLELVPHILVASETSQLAAGGSTPITNLHVLLQATFMPLYGLGVAALAFTGFRRVAPAAACVLGVIGGAALTIVGPMLLLSDNPKFGVIFMPGAGTFLFLIAVGLRLARAEGRAPSLRPDLAARV